MPKGDMEFNGWVLEGDFSFCDKDLNDVDEMEIMLCAMEQYGE